MKKDLKPCSDDSNSSNYRIVARIDLVGFREVSEKEKTEKEKLELARKGMIESEKPVRAVTFSPDGLTLASSDDDGSIHIWKTEDGAALETLRPHTGSVCALAYTPRGDLISAAEDKVLDWDLETSWRLDRAIGTSNPDSPIFDRVNALAFDPEGKWLASAGGEPTRSGDVQVWDVLTGKLHQSFTNIHSDTVLGLAFSADGKHIASGGADKIIKVIELASGKVIRQFEGHTHHVLGISWSRNQRILASGGADNVVNIWDFQTGEKQSSIGGFDKEVTSVNFLGYTEQILASSGDGKTRLLGADGKDIRSFSGGIDFINSAAITRDGRIVIAGGQDAILRVWDAKGGHVIGKYSPLQLQTP